MVDRLVPSSQRFRPGSNKITRMELGSKRVAELQTLLRQCTAQVCSEGVIGTGFFAAPTLLLTCAHVVARIDPGDEVEIRRDGHDPLTGRLLKKVPNPYHEGDLPDIALICLKDVKSEQPYVLLDLDNATAARDHLYSWGFPPTSPEGESITPNCEGEGRRFLIKFRAAQTLPGMSGAPLLNDRIGRVSGMIKITRDDETDLGGWAIRSSVILEHFPELLEHQRNEALQALWKTLPASPPNPQVIKSKELSLPDRLAVEKAILRCQSIKDPNGRQAAFDDLPLYIYERIDRGHAQLDDVRSAVKTCLRFEGGLSALCDIILEREGESIAADELRAHMTRLQI